MAKRKTLSATHTLNFTPRRPYNFDATVHKPDHFPSADNHWEPGVRWQTMRWQNVPLGLKIESRGTTHKPKVCVTVWAGKKLDRRFLNGLRHEISRRYSFELDLSEFNRRFRDDPQLGPALRRWRGMRPMDYCSLYEGIIICIVLQNATVRRTVSMLQALFEAYGALLVYDDREHYCYWPPSALDRVTEQDLRDLKVGYRAKNIKKVTDAFATGVIDESEFRRKSREGQREDLGRLYGLGPASIGYILGELDHISPWEQKIYSKLFFDVDPDDPVPADVLLAFFDRHFGEHKMLAVRYIWEDLFWKRKHEHIPWLEKLIRL